MKKLLVLTLFFAAVTSVFAQSRLKIKGHVFDKATNEALIGVSIVLESSKTTGTITDPNGNFEITVPDAQSQLIVSYIGYKSETLPVSNKMDIALTSSAKGLDEIVVVGYGSMKKSDLTGSVSSIKSKDLNVMSSVNVQSSMAGRAAGVQVVSSGSVDGAVKVRVRGIGTINNSDPLYVVDGFSTTDISYLAPSDIASMEILKDASATAIYGSRGANGVILITTKGGKNQPTKISVNSYYGASTASKTLNVLNASGYSKARIEAYTHGNQTMNPNDLAVLNYSITNNKQGTDWQKEVLRTGIVQNYNVSAVGGSDKMKYNLSTSYNSTEGILKNAFVNKLFIRLNTEYQLTKAVRFGSDISFINADMSASDLSNAYGAGLMLAARSAPVTPVYDQNGNWQQGMTIDRNPARVVDFTKYNKNHQNKFVGNFYLNVDLMKGLSFKSTFGAAYTLSNNSNYLPVYYVGPIDQNATSSLTEVRSTDLSWVWSNVATYNFKINKVHKFTAMLGSEATYDSYNGISATAYGVAENENMRYLSAQTSSGPNTSSQGTSTIFSTFLRLNYSYDNKYMLTTTLRSDVSSRFSEANRQGIFPSLSFGWNIKEENFMKDISVISQLKLRAGWGQVGNQSSTGIGDYLSTISNGHRYMFGGQVYEGRIPVALSNPNLKWETAEQTNVGLDLGFFDNKLQFTADYFIKNTKNMIVTPPAPFFGGADPSPANVGSMRNNGFEFTVNHNNQVGGIKYNVGLNLSLIKNELTSLGKAGSIYTTVIDRLGATSVTAVGQPIASYWGYKTDGIFHSQAEVDAYTYKDASGAMQPIQPGAQPGDVKYIKTDGTNSAIGASDMTYLGSYIPTFMGGFNFGLEYKHFVFSLFTDFSYGGKIANTTDYALKSPLMDKNILQSYYDNRWTPETPNNSEPQLNASHYVDNLKFSDRYIEDGSFFRIRNIQVGYNVPSDILRKVNISALKVYVSADNLATFTKYSGYNPEVGDQYNNPLAAGQDMGSTPLPRTVSVGFNLNF